MEMRSPLAASTMLTASWVAPHISRTSPFTSTCYKRACTCRDQTQRMRERCSSEYQALSFRCTIFVHPSILRCPCHLVDSLFGLPWYLYRLAGPFPFSVFLLLSFSIFLIVLYCSFSVLFCFHLCNLLVISFLFFPFVAIPVILVSFLPCMLPGDIRSAPALGVVGIACMAKSPVLAMCISVFLLFVVCDHGLVSL